MPGLLSRIFRLRSGSQSTDKIGGKSLNRSATSINGHSASIHTDPWEKTSLRREDVVELLKACCDELKARGLDSPLFLLPFRPSSDLTSTRTFIRKYFEGGRPTLRGRALSQELRLTDVLVISGVLRWVWTRLDGGVVGWESYDLFAKAERDSGYARDAFNLLMPLSVGSELRTAIILDFFAFLASVAAHAKSNGFNGQRLARIAGWYAFDIKGSSSGFVDGYANWEKAANATEHLFLAYLRSIAPTPGQISAALPLSLSNLLNQATYPPRPTSATPIAPGATSILRITLLVRAVSPTPFALLDRLARHSFIQTNPNEKGDALETIIETHTEHGSPTKALTPECLRVLRLISATNESDVLTAALLRTPNSLEDKTWTRFADLGFEGLDNSDGDLSDGDSEFSTDPDPTSRRRRRDLLGGGINRPKTPSWGDFLVSGFPEGAGGPGGGGGFSLPPDKLLPPINTTTLPHSVSSRRSLNSRDGGGGGYKSNLHELEKGEVKSVERSRVDDALWSVWMESLCGEELEEKKAVFGRCVVAETNAPDAGRRWIVVEEIVKGAETTPELHPTQKKKGLSKKARKAAEKEEEQLKRRAQQRRSTSDLGRRRDEDGSLVGREMRAQQLAKQSATLRTIKERELEGPLAPPPQRRRSAEYNGRPSTSMMPLGADVSRAMKWAEGGLDSKTFERSRNIEKPKPKPVELPPPPPPPQQAPTARPNPVQIESSPRIEPKIPEKIDILQEIPREPTVAPKVQLQRSKSPEPVQGPVLLSPDTAYGRSLTPEPKKSQPNKLKKLFGGKTKEEKEAKRASRAMSPIPPQTPPQSQDRARSPLPPIVQKPTARAPSPAPIVDAKELYDDFDGIHRVESHTSTPDVWIPPPTTKPDLPKGETYVPKFTPKEDHLDPPAPAPVVRSATPTREQTSSDDEMDRWAQIRKAAGQRALNRVVAPPKNNGDSSEVGEVNIPRTRQATAGSPPRKLVGRAPLRPDEEDEESVDARVARIRKRVQELTAGMGDDD